MKVVPSLIGVTEAWGENGQVRSNNNNNNNEKQRNTVLSPKTSIQTKQQQPSDLANVSMNGAKRGQVEMLTNAISEETYVPLVVARRMLAEAENDMQAMKQEHLTVIDEMEKNFRLIEKETQEYFLTYIDKLNKAAEERQLEHQRLLAHVTEGAQQYKESATATVNSLTEKLKAAEKIATTIQEKLKEEVEKRRHIDQELCDCVQNLKDEREVHSRELVDAEKKLGKLKRSHGKHQKLAEEEKASIRAELVTTQAEIDRLKGIIGSKTAKIGDLEAELQRTNEESAALLEETMAQLHRVENDRDAVREQLQMALSRSGSDVKLAAEQAKQDLLKHIEDAFVTQATQELNRLLQQREGLQRCGTDINAVVSIMSAVNAEKDNFSQILSQLLPSSEAVPKQQDESQSNVQIIQTIEQKDEQAQQQDQQQIQQDQQQIQQDQQQIQQDQQQIQQDQQQIQPNVRYHSALLEISPAMETLEIQIQLAARENIVIALEALITASSEAAQAAQLAQASITANNNNNNTNTNNNNNNNNNNTNTNTNTNTNNTTNDNTDNFQDDSVVSVVPMSDLNLANQPQFQQILDENAALRQRLAALQAALANAPRDGNLEAEVPNAQYQREQLPQMPASQDPQTLKQYVNELQEAHEIELAKFKEVALKEANALRQQLAEITLENEESLARVREAAEESAEELRAARSEVEELMQELQEARDATQEMTIQLRGEISDLEEQLLQMEEEKRRNELSENTIEREKMEAALREAKEEQERLAASLKLAEVQASAALNAEAQAELEAIRAMITQSETTMHEKMKEVEELAKREEELRQREAEANENAKKRAEAATAEAMKLEAEKEKIAKELEERREALNQKRQAAESKQGELVNAIDKVPVRRLGKSNVNSSSGGGGGGSGSGSGGVDSAVVKQLEAQLKEANRKLKLAESKSEKDAEKLKKLEQQLAKASSSGGGSGSGDNSRDMKMAQKKFEDQQKKQLKELEKEKAISKKAKEQLEQSQQEVTDLTKQNKQLTTQLVEVGRAAEELAAAKVRETSLQEKCTTLETELGDSKKEREDLEKEYKKEVMLRKKYYNIIEDMKGKIRVYCRCRPFNKRELEMKSPLAVKWPDDMTIDVTTAKDTKTFTFDECFQPNSAQDRVCEPTLHLVQSAIDGYNVCIFAYGQTGSGKTFTMYGPSDNPGVAPRAMKELFTIMEREQGTLSVEISCYMLELYNDQLVDLLAEKVKGAGGQQQKAEELKIKQDAKGIVFVQGAVIRPANSFEELERWNKLGFDQRHVASTQMNAESSRSHLIFSILVNTTNKQTGNKTLGKITLVDLAGSERVAKTGATADRLKEATSINKSLSALGDVISALSSGGDKAKHVPYRNNKLTMLLQDGLGGNAKTLMFVNISPAEFNADETQTSLLYASRVKLITNSAEKEKESKEVARLKAIIEKLKAGQNVAVEEDRPETPPQPDAAPAENDDEAIVDGY